MDPYIEACGLWAYFHNALIAEIYRVLNEVLPRRYVARHEPTVAVRYAVCFDLESSRTPPFLECEPDDGMVAFQRPVADEALVALRD
jgi:hypothetical protein